MFAETLDPTRLKCPLHRCGSSLSVSHSFGFKKARTIPRPRARRTESIHTLDPSWRTFRFDRPDRPVIGKRGSLQGWIQSCQCAQIRRPEEEKQPKASPCCFPRVLYGPHFSAVRVTLPTEAERMTSGIGIVSMSGWTSRMASNEEPLQFQYIERVLSVSLSLSTTIIPFNSSNSRRESG